MIHFDGKLRAAVIITCFALCLSVFFTSFGRAEPSGASLSYVDSDSGPNATAGSRSDLGGTIVTLNLDIIQQDSAWKAYVGNVTGKLVLRNSDSFSIYEWALDDSTLTGNIFITRASTVNWTPIRCANETMILAEDAALGNLGSETDSINRTFNYSEHDAMIISGIGTIAAGDCQNIATYVNGSAQTINSDAFFQEILLTDTQNLVYATFIDQNKEGFGNNDTHPVTYDFQIIVGENRTAQVGNTYYFFADIR